MAAVMRKLKPFMAARAIKFKDPDTGHHYYAKTRGELVQKIVNYRAQNELDPIESLDIVLEDYLCSLPENKHLCASHVLERGFMGYVKGGVNLLMNMLFKNYVSQEEANRRAEICKSCEENVSPEPEKLSSFRRWTDDIAYNSVGERSTPYDADLYTCNVCTCVLRTKVWNAEIVKESKETNDRFPNHCWAKRAAAEAKVIEEKKVNEV